MRYLSLFSGISADHVAWCQPCRTSDPSGEPWECIGFSEVDPAACAVLEHKYPDISNFGDITKITEDQIWNLGQIDLIIASSPCQGLSIAGSKKGIGNAANDRYDAHQESRLFWDAIRIIRWAGECGLRFAVWENVPGAFSSNHGRDFASVVGAFSGMECSVPKGGWKNSGVLHGPGLGFSGRSGAIVEWRTLDALYAGGCPVHGDEFTIGPVPQRRRRIFAVASFRDWASRPPVLFESESLYRDPAQGRKKRKETASATGDDVTRNGRETGRGPCPTLPARKSAGGGFGTDFDLDGGLIQSAIPLLEPGSRTGVSTTDIRAGSGIGNSGDTMFTLQSGRISMLVTSTGHTSHCLNAGGMGRQDYETETMVIAPHPQGSIDEDTSLSPGDSSMSTVAFKSSHFTRGKDGAPATHAPSPSADADRGNQDTLMLAPRFIGSFEQNSMAGSGTLGWSEESHLRPVKPQSDHQMIVVNAPVAFTVKDHGSDAGEYAPTLRAMGHADSHANGGGQVGICMNLRGREGGAMPEMADAASLRAPRGGSSNSYAVVPESPMTFDERQITSATNRSQPAPGRECHTLHPDAPRVVNGFAVRKLTPKECLRLQGFPDSYADGVMLRGRPLSDSAIYKMTGNSIAVPCLRWIKRRIEWSISGGQGDEP